MIRNSLYVDATRRAGALSEPERFFDLQSAQRGALDGSLEPTGQRTARMEGGPAWKPPIAQRILLRQHRPRINSKQLLAHNLKARSEVAAQLQIRAARTRFLGQGFRVDAAHAHN